MKQFFTCLLFAISFIIKIQAQICPITSASSELIINGDFSAGNMGFSTVGITYTDSAMGLGYYTIGTNPAGYKTTAFAKIGDHTTGAGNMLIVNSADTTKDVYKTTVITAPNTLYYLSIWIANIDTQTISCPTCTGGFELFNRPLFAFMINGIQVGDLVFASNINANWNQYYVSWNSGAGGSTTIEIQNRFNNVETFNEFALDDVSFNTSCKKLTNLSSLGIPSTMSDTIFVCDKVFPYTLDSGLDTLKGYTFQWLNSSGSFLNGINNQSVYTVTSAPVASETKYYLCYQSPLNVGCPRTDSVLFIHEYNVEIGPGTDFVLCKSSSVVLKCEANSPPTNIGWFKNDTIIAGQTSSELFVNAAGMYSAQITSSIADCPSEMFNFVVTNKITTPINSTFCNPPQSVSLSVSPVNSGKYKWWNDPVSTDPINLLQTGGNMFTFNASNASTYTVYAEDTSYLYSTVGPQKLFLGGGAGYSNTSSLVAFTANQDFSLLSLQAPIIFYYLPTVGTEITMTIEIKDANGVSFSPAKIFTSNPTSLIKSVSVNGLYTFTFNGCNILSSWGPNLTVGLFIYPGITLTNGADGYVQSYTGYANPSYPYNSNPPSPVSITGSYNGSFTTIQYGSFFNWNIRVGSSCERIPVQAIYDCSSAITTNLASTKTDQKSFQIYPNPINSGSSIKLQFPYQASYWNIAVYNVNGQIVYKGKSDSSETEISSASYVPSVYVVEITDGEKLFYGKVVVQ